VLDYLVKKIKEMGSIKSYIGVTCVVWYPAASAVVIAGLAGGAGANQGSS